MLFTSLLYLSCTLPAVLSVSSTYASLNGVDKSIVLQKLDQRFTSWGFETHQLSIHEPADEAYVKGWVAAVADHPSARFIPLHDALRVPGTVVAMPIEPRHAHARQAMWSSPRPNAEPWAVLSLDSHGSAEQVYAYIHSRGVDAGQMLARFHADPESGTALEVLARVGF